MDIGHNIPKAYSFFRCHLAAAGNTTDQAFAFKTVAQIELLSKFMNASQVGSNTKSLSSCAIDIFTQCSRICCCHLLARVAIPLSQTADGVSKATSAPSVFHTQTPDNASSEGWSTERLCTLKVNFLKCVRADKFKYCGASHRACYASFSRRRRSVGAGRPEHVSTAVSACVAFAMEC
eukprot:8159-Heterococcus_DN1.PRE.4